MTSGSSLCLDQNVITNVYKRLMTLTFRLSLVALIFDLLKTQTLT